MRKFLLLLTCSTCFLFSHAIAVNDECAGAISLTVNAGSSCTNVYTANVTDATQSLAPCVAMSYEPKDVWYKFTATGTSHTLTLNPDDYTDFVIQVYNGSCTSLSSIACINNSGINEIEGGTLNNLVAGNTYFLRVFSKIGWASYKFRLCINSNASVIPNDEPAGAIDRPATGPTANATYTNLGATLSLPACTGSAAKDIWFKFTATGTRHFIRYNSSGHIDYPTAIEVFSGTPGSLTSIKCYGATDNQADISDLTVGATYYYRVYISNGNAVSTNLSTWISPPLTAPVNDECAGAISLTVNAGSSCTNVYTANVTDATQSLAPCVAMSYEPKDVWYKFTATGTSHTLTLNPDDYTDFVIQVYNGSCTSLSSIACINNSGINEIEGGTLTNLIAGNTYFLRVFSKIGWASYKFRLCINASTSLIPNDEPAGAIDRPATGPTANSTYTNLGATLSLPACTGSAAKDIWFKFTATGTRHFIRYNSSGHIDYPTAIEVFSGTPGSLTSIKCYGATDNQADISDLTVGATYYYRVYISNGNAVSTNLSTWISPPLTAPVNDECAGAISLTVNAGSSCTNVYTANVTDATQSLAPCVAMSYEPKDVWYKFTATGTSHTLTLNPDDYTDFVIQVYNGSCTSLSSIACINNSGINEIEGGTLNNLIAGNTYFLRVFSRIGWASYKFRLCINSNASVIPNDEPAGAINRPTTGSTSNATYTNLGATLSLPACTGSAAKDIWFKFTATHTRHIVRYSSHGHIDYPTAVEVFSGTPGNLTSIKCYGATDNYADIAGLTVGATYYYRIYISNGNAVSTDLSNYVATPVSLPLNFVSFAVKNQDNTNYLSWETSDEINVSGFEVQVSKDGTLFEKIAFIPYVETGRPSNNYSYQHRIDALASNKVLYYRIKEVDKDNSFLYSKIVSVKMEPSPVISIFPNPVKNLIYIKSNNANVFSFEIFDLGGRKISEGKAFNNTIDVGHLKQGVFVLKLQRDALSKMTFLVVKGED